MLPEMEDSNFKNRSLVIDENVFACVSPMMKKIQDERKEDCSLCKIILNAPKVNIFTLLMSEK